MYQHFENKARLNVNTENTSVALSVTKYFLPFLHKKNKILYFVTNNICISKERIDSNFLNNYRNDAIRDNSETYRNARNDH